MAWSCSTRHPGRAHHGSSRAAHRSGRAAVTTCQPRLGGASARFGRALRGRGCSQTGVVTTDLCTPHTLISSDGAQLTVCAHGGHVLGWTPAGGQPRLWLSPTTECGPGLAIRGGIPVIFPQFAGRGPLPKHGVARNRGWQVPETEPGITPDGPATWRAVLTDDSATREIWPHRFELTLTATAAGDRLDLTFGVRNTGTEEWAFTAALHSYLALGHPGTLIHGLGGRPAEDNAAAGAPITLGAPGEALVATD